jgi:protein-tyrosine kinase
VLKKEEKGLITFRCPDSTISEQYRAIRTNIHFLSMDQKDKVFVITSPSFGEGKSTITTNLAISIVQQGKRVLVVDAHLQKPTIHSTFNIKNNNGLTNLLMGKTTLEEAITKTQIEGLEVVTSGAISSHSAELLGLQAVEEFIVKARRNYDFVLFDSPPVLEITDARILAHKCDGVILVLCKSKTKSQMAAEAKRQLDLASAKIKGVILNQKV